MVNQLRNYLEIKNENSLDIGRDVVVLALVTVAKRNCLKYLTKCMNKRQSSSIQVQLAYSRFMSSTLKAVGQKT